MNTAATLGVGGKVSQVTVAIRIRPRTSHDEEQVTTYVQPDPKMLILRNPSQI